MKKITKTTAILLVWLLLLIPSVYAQGLLIPGGELVGISLEDQQVTVAAFDKTLGQEAQAAGLKIGDRLVKVDSKTITCIEDVRQALLCSDGQVQVTIDRGGKVLTLKLTPQITQQGPKLGLYLKEGVTGVGTVTWYDPATGAFGALGHGVNSGNGELLRIRQGSVYEATILWVNQGKVGTPGQLMGALNGQKPLGTIEKNTSQGVFGKLEQPVQGEALPVAQWEQVHTGEATIRSTVENQKTREYSVEILKIYPESGEEGRNFLIKITDPTLLSQTGGIVQGMSGSPIIQDGRLIGAVTHVLVNDPTTGYGIFIENMLEAAG